MQQFFFSKKKIVVSEKHVRAVHRTRNQIGVSLSFSEKTVKYTPRGVCCDPVFELDHSVAWLDISVWYSQLFGSVCTLTRCKCCNLSPRVLCMHGIICRQPFAGTFQKVTVERPSALGNLHELHM